MMTIRTISTTLVAAITMMAAHASAAALSVGDAAPPLSVGKWVKGEPVKEFEKGKLYVVEFWATWCGPCIQSIPHITAMAKANPQVTFIGTSVWENDDADVEPFIKKMGDKMDYHVAVDDKSSVAKGAMAISWMEAAGQNGIPTAFIVNKEGLIAWIGHPMEMEPVLAKVVEGKYDMGQAKKESTEAIAKQEAAQKIQGELQAKIGPPMQKQDWDAVAKGIDEVIAAHPDAADQLYSAKFGLMIRGKKYDAAYEAADHIAKANNDNAQMLNQLAWYIAADKGVEKRDLDRAAKYASRAVELTESKNGAVLDTFARIMFDKGNIEKAISLQTMAIEVSATDKEKAELKSSLEKYKAALPK